MKKSKLAETTQCICLKTGRKGHQGRRIVGGEDTAY